MTVDEQAPAFPAGGNWRSARYPLGGSRTGPAWRAMWKMLGTLADGEWAIGADLQVEGAKAGACSLQTARLLLIRAANAGVLEKVTRTVGSREQTCYRRASDVYRGVVRALADGRFDALPSYSARWLEELVQRGTLERRVRGGEAQYRLTWKPPAR